MIAKNKKSRMNMLLKMSIVSVALVAMYAFSVKPAVTPLTGATGIFVVADDTIYQFVETMPEFIENLGKDGEENLPSFLSKNIVYPPEAFQNGIKGTVYVEFIVEKDGSISNAKVLRGVESSLDAEALRVVNLMPKWMPGRKNGNPARVQFTIPIKFAPPQKNNPVEDQTAAKTEIDENKIYKEVDEMPMFVGEPGKSSEESLRMFLSRNVVTPYQALQNGIQGTIYISFVVEKDGSVSNANVIRGVHPLLDNEALRVVNLMPKWIPGKKDGKVVRTKFTIPIKFEQRDSSRIRR